MSLAIAHIGATGLVGKLVAANLINTNHHYYPIARKEIDLFKASNCTFYSIDESSEQKLKLFSQCDVFISTLGTTLKSAGSKERFIAIDKDLVYQHYQLAKEAGVRTAVLLSSYGANARSSNFYLRVKGELEELVRALNFEQLHIINPSLLIGEREESRFLEGLGQSLMRPLVSLFPNKGPWPVKASEVARQITETF